MTETAVAAGDCFAYATNGATVGALLERMREVLAGPFGRDATADARELLGAMLDQPRHWASVERERVVDAETWRHAMRAAHRHALGVPLQYAAGRASFRHLTLAVDERVLIPRPETEVLVDIVLEAFVGEQGGTAVDVGTGSGAIALALATEGRFARVIATDVSGDALAVAETNLVRCAPMLRARVELRHGSLLAPVHERGVRAIVSNPPYVAHDEAKDLPHAVRGWEPPVALFSGDGGMSITARLLREAVGVLAPRGLLAIETDTRRAASLGEMLEANGGFEDVRVLRDLTGRERFAVARRRET